MKKISLTSFLDQRRFITHIWFLLFSMVMILLFIIIRSDFRGWNNYLISLVVVLLQLEIFLFLGKKFFGDLNPASSPREITIKLLRRFLFFYVTCFIVAFIIMLVIKLIESSVRYHDAARIYRDFFHLEFRDWLGTTLTGLSIGALLFLFFNWQDALKREQKLREEKLVFQHETLKSQVNPHFLFNSLNTISSLIRTQPDTAEQFVKNLSSVYRYILENGQKDKVPLQSELDFITGYFDLHKIRDEEKIILSVDAPDSENFKVLPVSLQILVENAIKHNIATRENQLKINIFIEGPFIVVKNNLQRKASQLQTTKTGLKNLAERVRLISGKELIIEDADNYFIVKLPLLS